MGFNDNQIQNEIHPMKGKGYIPKTLTQYNGTLQEAS